MEETKPNYYDTQKETSASIVAQVIIKAVADMVSSGKIEPGAFKANATILVGVYKETKEDLLKA